MFGARSCATLMPQQLMRCSAHSGGADRSARHFVEMIPPRPRLMENIFGPSLVCDVSLIAFRFGSLFENNLFRVFHVGSFVLDPRLQPFVWDLAFVIRRFVMCLQTANHILLSHADTKTTQQGTNKTNKKVEGNRLLTLGRFCNWPDGPAKN